MLSRRPRRTWPSIRTERKAGGQPRHDTNFQPPRQTGSQGRRGTSHLGRRSLADRSSFIPQFGRRCRSTHRRRQGRWAHVGIDQRPLPPLAARRPWFRRPPRGRAPSPARAERSGHGIGSPPASMCDREAPELTPLRSKVQRRQRERRGRRDYSSSISRITYGRAPTARPDRHPAKPRNRRIFVAQPPALLLYPQACAVRAANPRNCLLDGPRP